MYKYKLKDEYLKDGERTFPGIGITKEGVIESATEIESPILDLVSMDGDNPKDTAPADQKPSEAKPISSATSTNKPEQE